MVNPAALSDVECDLAQRPELHLRQHDVRPRGDRLDPLRERSDPRPTLRAADIPDFVVARRFRARRDFGTDLTNSAGVKVKMGDHVFKLAIELLPHGSERGLPERALFGDSGLA